MADIKNEKDVQITEDGVSTLYADYSSSDDTGPSRSQDTAVTDNAQLSGKSLTFSHSDFPWRDIQIASSDGSPAYFASISAFKPNTPDIVLHSTDKTGPVVGQAHFRWSFSIKAGVSTSRGGEAAAAPGNMAWTDMKRGGVLNRKNYSFLWNARCYTLKRTHSGQHGLTGYSKAMFSHMKIVDEETGELVALYVSQPGVAKKRGTVTFREGVGREMEILCILGFAAWREKVARSSGGKSGGGGG